MISLRSVFSLVFIVIAIFLLCYILAALLLFPSTSLLDLTNPSLIFLLLSLEKNKLIAGTIGGIFIALSAWVPHFAKLDIERSSVEYTRFFLRYEKLVESASKFRHSLETFVYHATQPNFFSSQLCRTNQNMLENEKAFYTAKNELECNFDAICYWMTSSTTMKSEFESNWITFKRGMICTSNLMLSKHKLIYSVNKIIEEEKRSLSQLDNVPIFRLRPQFLNPWKGNQPCP